MIAREIPDINLSKTQINMIFSKTDLNLAFEMVIPNFKYLLS